MTRALLVLLFFTPTVFADGKFYFREPVPAKEPYQRALLAWDGQQELLLVQPKLEGKASEFAWVLPVPAEPQVGVVEAETADECFGDADIASTPRARALRPWVLSFLACLCVVWLCRSARKRRYPSLLVALAGLIVTSGYLPPALMKDRGGAASSADVTILLEQQLGLYDIKVVRSEKPGALFDWLNAHGFRHGPADQEPITAYERQRWCFVTAKVRPGLDASESWEGLLDALALRFAAPTPVYPFALTASYDHETEVLLYAFGDHKLTHPALELGFAGSVDAKRIFGEIDWISGIETVVPSQWTRWPSYLTKLKGRLSKHNAVNDLVLGQSPDDAPYREARWKW